MLESLNDGFYYSKLNMDGENDLYLVTTGVYEENDGTTVTIFATVYGPNSDNGISKYGELRSMGTAYPLRATSENLFYGGGHFVT